MEGWTLYGDESMLTLEREGVMLRFDIKIPTCDGMVFGIYIKPLTNDDVIKHVMNHMPGEDYTARTDKDPLGCGMALTQIPPMKSQDTTSQVRKGEKAKQLGDCQVSEAAEGETSGAASSETSDWVDKIDKIDDKNEEEEQETKIDNCLIVDKEKLTMSNHEEELEMSNKLAMNDVEKMSDKDKMRDKEKELAISKEDLVTPRSKKENMKKSEVGKLFHVKKWTRSELFNSEREYCLRKMRANVCDGHDENLFVIEGWSDSKYDKNAMQQSICWKSVLADIRLLVFVQTD
ncbi:unnamed protein product [Cylindrotheca closterium]|uniref:Uncharacterized protein n=1 Tax=Cylindrotheca closterium TaxID=2856 RepID=A0AAD2CT93_9STRA|nr:unnamed protein product [Cylindrotheca closterium]